MLPCADIMRKELVRESEHICQPGSVRILACRRVEDSDGHFQREMDMHAFRRLHRIPYYRYERNCDSNGNGIGEQHFRSKDRNSHIHGKQRERIPLPQSAYDTALYTAGGGENRI